MTSPQESVAQELQKIFDTPLSVEQSTSVERWVQAYKAEPSAKVRPPWVPGSYLMSDVATTGYGETLLVFFRWPLAPRRVFVYIEELEDLSPMDSKSWANVVIAHIDETISGNFYDRLPITRIGSLDFVSP
jgi:hypothetical protein